MFYIKDQDGTNHEFHSERYARGVLYSRYEELLRQFEKEPERYEIASKTLLFNEFRISVKDKSRLYFLGRTADIKNITYTSVIKHKIMGNVA